MIIKEIQGLRALSVFLILFYHLGFNNFKFGFLAVDVFFVISGLIFSKLIFTDLDKNNFSFKKYSIKRAKRLFPGLFIVIFFVSIISWLFLIPNELKYYGQSLFSTSTFISNIYFYIVNNDNFSPNTYSLLHLWSLSLELQFYIIYPILILLIYFFKTLKKNINLIFFLILILSFYLNIFLAENEIFKFYFLPTRLWEFLTGYFIFFRISKNNLNYDLKTNFYSYLILVILLSYLIVGTNQVLKNPNTYYNNYNNFIFFSYNRKNF